MSMQRLSTRASPISDAEFYKVFQSLWKRWSGGEESYPYRIGIAVSGGPDSMALAYLCSKLPLPKQEFPLSPLIKAYIVDHKYRPESSREAQLVAERVGELGINAEVLTLKWPTDGPIDVKGFETRARTLRYQALGKACASDGIRALLLGHHQDDNIETALMRLATGHRMPGLTGYDDIAPIPECHGIYHVKRSEMTTDITTILRTKNMDGVSDHRTAKSNMPTLSTGGVYLFRPFRSFPKSQLEATCQENNIQVVSDSTNQDHTFTVRNTVRSLLRSGDLPRALQSQSLLKLVEKSRDEAQRTRKIYEKVLNKIKILNFDTRFGTVIVQVPKLTHIFPNINIEDIGDSNQPLNEMQEVYCLVMRSLCNLVSPQADRATPLTQYSDGASKVFSRIYPDLSVESNKFTAGGVLWQELQLPPKLPKSKVIFPGNLVDPKLEKCPNLPVPGASRESSTWLISRRLHDRNEDPTLNLSIRIPKCFLSETHPGSYALRRDHENDPSNAFLPFYPTAWTGWHLWDNRYWIRIRASPFQSNWSSNSQDHPDSQNGVNLSPIYSTDSTIPVALRVLRREDLSEIRTSIWESKWRRNRLHQSNFVGGQVDFSSFNYSLRPPKNPRYVGLKEFKTDLSLLAPGKIRFTAPVLTVGRPATGVEPEKGERGGQTIVALPTYPLTIQPNILVKTPFKDPVSNQLTGTTQNIPWTVQWEVRYKYVDPHTARSVSWHLPAQSKLKQTSE
ncbi:hypothetical protein FQN57_003255 [Myotisia sp. PD_48]|nr:hypothetical protein FQN57_003255 [Myotisia sp. PD_48]